MNAAEWNGSFMPGTRFVVTLANGDCLTTRTASDASRIGQHDMLMLEGRVGYYLLAWCQALVPPAQARPFIPNRAESSPPLATR